MASIRRMTKPKKDGSTRIRWEVDTYIDGKRHKNSSFKTKRDAEVYLKSLSTLELDKKQKTEMTFLDAANDFMSLFSRKIYSRFSKKK